jgi:sacsin
LIEVSQGPRKLEFNQTERITARLRDLVRNYPKGLGLVKEFLQNADDAGASRLVVIYDRRQHNGIFVDNPAMEVALGPSLLFVNDQIFSEDDYKRIQQIGEGGKVREAARTGRFGQGFNTCYSVSDHPSLLTDEFIAWFDPHHQVIEDGSNASAWPLADVEEYWPDWINTFEPAGWSQGTLSFSGTAFRLPLRSVQDADRSEILKEPFTDDDFSAILEELHQVGAALLVFLRSVLHLEIREIDSDGKDHLRFKISSAHPSTVEGHRKIVRSIVDGNPKEVLERWIESKIELPVELYNHSFLIQDIDGTQRVEYWAVVTGLFRGTDDILLHSALEVWNHNEKAIPWAGAAVCIDTIGNNPKPGGLACFLPLPEQTKWPVWLNGWFDLSSNRKGITRDADVGETTRSRYKWNKLLMEYAVGKAWALLAQFIQGKPEENLKPYELWLRPPDKPDDVDSALIVGFYHSLSELSIVRARDSKGHKWFRIDEIRDLPAEWNDRISEPLLAEGWVLTNPSFPEFVRQGFRKAKRYQSSILSKTFRYELRKQDSDPDISCRLESAPRPMLGKREWIYALAEFCADGDWDNLQQLPLALLSDGLLHTFTTCGKLFLANNDERALLHPLHQRFLDADYQNAIKLNSPSQAINLVSFDLSGLLEFVPEILSQGSPERLWLVRFFDYLTSCNEEEIAGHKDNLKELFLIPDQNGKFCQMCLVETPLMPGKVTIDLLAALTELGIPILTAEDDLKSAIARFASKHKGFVWELTPNDIAYNLKLHAQEACLNEDVLDDRKILEPLLDFLSSSPWLSESDDRLDSLRQLRILPTTCGHRVAAQDESVYIPGFRPPNGFEGQYRLLNTGRGDRWLSLFEALNVPRLDGVIFVKRVLLPAFSSATLDQCRDYLKWIRDDFRSVERDITEEERKELRKEVRQKPIIPVEGGGLLPPRLVYRPDATEPIDLLGDFARIPDKEFFAVDKDLWLEFYDEFDLPRRPRARDLYVKIKALSDEAAIAGTDSIKAQLRKLIDHIRDRWSTISSITVDGSLSLAEALSKFPWLPAATDANNYAAGNKWPDRLWRANELVPGRLAHLCASKYPILEGNELSPEMAAGLGLITKLSLNDVLEHFSAVRLKSINDDTSMDAVHKAAEGIYRYIGQLDAEKVVQSANLLENLTEEQCIFIAGKWWHPSQCFFDPLPFATDWAVSLTMTNLSIGEHSVSKGLASLGVRQRPDNDDWILLLTDYADKFQGKSLPQVELNQVRYAIRLLRSATTEWLLDQDVFIPLHDGRLEMARHTLVPDDPRLKNYVGTNQLPLIEDNEDAFDVGRRSGSKSLRGALNERLKNQPFSTRNSTYSELADKLEAKLSSKQFYQSLQRIAYEEALRARDNDDNPLESASKDELKLPQRMQVVICPSINVETVVEIDGEEVVVFDLESPCFLDKETLRFWLKEGKQRRIKDDTVRAICELCGLSDQLRLSRVLEADPENMSKVLDEEEVATIPEGQVLELESNLETVTVEESIDSVNFDDFGEEEPSEMSLEDEDLEDDSAASSKINDGSKVQHHTLDSTSKTGTTNAVTQNPLYGSEYTDSSKSLEPPTRPGHGSSNPWSDNPSTESEQNGDNSGVTSHPPRPHGSPFTPHSPGNPSPNGHVQYHSSTKSRTSFPDGPPTNPGHGSSKQWDSQVKGAPDSSRQVRMRTYVHEKIHDDYDTGDADSRAKKLGNAGEEIVMEYEKKRKRTARRMPVNHEGYDIESKGRDGIRYIEVKSIDGPWGDRGVGVTRAQYEAAMRLGKEWWLYVVEYVTDPSRKKVHPIANPFHLVTEFRFDSGWMGAQVDDSGVSPVPSKPKIGASYERASGEVVKVEGTTQRGEFWRVSFVDADGTMQRAMWDASWRII